MALQASLLLLLLCLLQPPHLSRATNIADFTYRFTSCGTSGREGPTVSECEKHYSGVDSLITKDNVLFEFPTNPYKGGQGFHVPREGLYNITLAGASGGRGLCNFERGRGALRRIQVYLTPDVELLVMVGQPGLGPCSVIENHELCTSPPRNFTETQACNQTWMDFLSREHTDDINLLCDFSGGGGGGGASMVRARNITTGEFYEFPLAVAGGGGGSPAILDYSSVELFRDKIDRSDGNQSSQELYLEFLDAKERFRFNPSIYDVEGVSGFRASTNSVNAGVGGGWHGFPNVGATVIDGRNLSPSSLFAEGGLSCESQFATFIPPPFFDVNGGFGGGGGGCGGGGGGGGYTGGAILDRENTVPGGGGYVVFFTNLDIEVVDLGDGLNEAEEGYVEIIPADFGCTDSYVILSSSAVECQCGGGATLAPNERDCYKGQELALGQGSTNVIISDTRTLHFSTFPLEKAALVYSIEATLVLGSESGRRQTGGRSTAEEAQCSVLFVGRDVHNELVISLASNPVSPTSGGMANQLAVVTDRGNGSFELASFNTFLPFPALVVGIIVTGNAACTIEGMRLKFNGSSQETAEAPINNYDFFSDIIKYFADNIVSSVEASLGLSSVTEAPPTSPSNSNTPVIAALVVVVVLLMLAVVIVIVLLLGYRAFQRHKVKRFVREATELPSLTNSGLNNLTYFANQTSPQDPISGDWPIHGVAAEGMTKEEWFENNRYGSVDMNGTASDGYEAMNYKGNGTPADGRGYEMLSYSDKDCGTLPSYMSARSSQLMSKYGVSAPEHDFSAFNRMRSSSSIRDHDWNYPRSSLIYMREIGEGQFGKVLLMKATNIAGYEGKIPVAVKTLASKDPDIVTKFRQEAELMKKFSHPNIVGLLGFNPGDDDDAAPLMILEYMAFGDLQSFLESHRPEDGRKSPIKEYHFYGFAIDIAQALDFLSQHKYVHRDVAARNCLVATGMRIKIADFGLARGVYDRDYYRVAGRAVLPIRWMAPESLIFGIFSSASDVWSYGVVLWEIVTFGELPLPGSSSQDIVDAAQEKVLYHSRSPDFPEELYEVMASCHAHDHEQRPSFAEIVTTLEPVLLSLADTEKDDGENAPDLPPARIPAGIPEEEEEEEKKRREGSSGEGGEGEGDEEEVQLAREMSPDREEHTAKRYQNIDIDAARQDSIRV